jgi:hypothetical protein
MTTSRDPSALFGARKAQPNSVGGRCGGTSAGPLDLIHNHY